MQVFPVEPTTLFVALRDRPFQPIPTTLPPVADVRPGGFKRLHERKVTRERVRSLRSHRIPLFRVRECCIAAALALFVWPDVTQMQSPAYRTDAVQRMSAANQAMPQAPFRMDPATTFRD